MFRRARRGLGGRRRPKRSAEILGIEHLEFWRYQRRLLEGESYRWSSRLRELLRTWRPDIVYAPHSDEMHADHRAAARITLRAASSARHRVAARSRCGRRCRGWTRSSTSLRTSTQDRRDPRLRVPVRGLAVRRGVPRPRAVPGRDVQLARRRLRRGVRARARRDHHAGAVGVRRRHVRASGVGPDACDRADELRSISRGPSSGPGGRPAAKASCCSSSRHATASTSRSRRCSPPEDMVFNLALKDQLDLIGDGSDPQVLDALLTTARDCGPATSKAFRFYFVPDDSPTGKRLQEAAARLGLVCHDEGELPSPVLDIAAGSGAGGGVHPQAEPSPAGALLSRQRRARRPPLPGRQLGASAAAGVLRAAHRPTRRTAGPESVPGRQRASVLRPDDRARSGLGLAALHEDRLERPAHRVSLRLLLQWVAISTGCRASRST